MACGDDRMVALPTLANVAVCDPACLYLGVSSDFLMSWESEESEHQGALQFLRVMLFLAFQR